MSRILVKRQRKLRTVAKNGIIEHIVIITWCVHGAFKGSPHYIGGEGQAL
jgi:hypothetical protein